MLPPGFEKLQLDQETGPGLGVGLQMEQGRTPDQLLYFLVNFGHDSVSSCVFVGLMIQSRRPVVNGNICKTGSNRV
mgnify:CR=1 FL=1